AWGIDGHNSHTNVCSAGARAGYAFWMGFDRPSPDHANARFMLLLSSHLESGHYFNPHAQRIIEGKMQGAKICVIDTRLSNTASMADWWLSPWPGSEAALLLAIARLLVLERRYDRAFVRRWVNWEEYLREERPDLPGTYEGFERALEELYASYTPEFAERESGIPAATILEIAGEIARSGSALATHVWRNTAAGNLGGWQVARALQFLVVLMGAVAAPGGTAPGAFNKAVPASPMMPAPGRVWSELLMPREYPLAFFEMSFLLPHFLKEGRGKLAMYFTRVYNPVWTNPDGMSWIEMLTDEAKVERHRVVRGLRPADGTRLRAPRPHEPGDARRALDRLPAAGAAGGAREAGQDVRSHLAGPRGGRPRAGVGGGRVLDRALVAHRSGRRARHPQVLRVALPARREAAHRGVLPLDLRAQRARPARGRRARGPGPARLHAQVRRLPGAGERLPHPRDAGEPGGARGCDGRRPVVPRDEERGRGRGGRGRAVDGRLSDALAQA